MTQESGRRRLRTPRQWESAVDRAIREAQERGEFDNLPGAGKPLRGERWDGEWGMAHHILKEAGETLPWIALGREIEEQRASLRAVLARAREELARDCGRPGWLEARRRFRRQYLDAAAVLDKLMEEFNFEVPIRRLDKGRFPPHVAERTFEEAVPISRPPE